MLIPALFFLITLIVGPLAFWVLSKVYYKHEPGRRFPMSAKGAVGDTVMLPLFNARAAYLFAPNFLFSPVAINIATILIVLISLGYLYYRLVLVPKLYKGNNWMQGNSRFFNGLGWYHFAYFVLQAFVILVSIFIYPQDVWIWVFLLGYVITAIVSHYQLKRKRGK